MSAFVAFLAGFVEDHAALTRLTPWLARCTGRPAFAIATAP